MYIEQTYGYFPGGPYDPRKFTPDRQVNTPEEIAEWERLCALWNAGGASVTPQSGTIREMGGHMVIACGSSLGMGTYEVDVDEDPEPGAEEDLPAVEVA